MKTLKWTLLLAFFALWACQEEQFSQEGTPFDASHPFPRVERLRTIKRVDNAPVTRAVGMSDKVIQYAAIWLQYANLHFEYVRKEENADPLMFQKI